MKILFVGANEGNSRNSYLSIKKIYPKTKILDTSKILNKFYYKIFYHIAPFFFNRIINTFYKREVNSFYDLIFLFNVDLINENSLNQIKKKSKKIYYFCADNPFVKRDKKKWYFIKKIICEFDLVIFHQKSREKFVKEYKIKKFVTILPPYYKNIHLIKNRKKPIKQIVFVGTWFPERGKFFYELKKRGLNFDICGMRWNKDKKYFRLLKKNIILKNFTQKQVAKIVSKYQINIALLSKENQDDITRRCIEIPAVGSLLCCERTTTMSKVLVENKEAVYFSGPIECFKKCKKLLGDQRLMNKISIKGNNKIIKILKPESERIYKKIFNASFINKNINKFIIKY
tara:strand:+ start:1547 stop:2575 length:1029 start_codon:yes stop_codon:yes gene_type:complete